MFAKANVKGGSAKRCILNVPLCGTAVGLLCERSERTTNIKKRVTPSPVSLLPVSCCLLPN